MSTLQRVSKQLLITLWCKLCWYYIIIKHPVRTSFRHAIVMFSNYVPLNLLISLTSSDFEIHYWYKRQTLSNQGNVFMFTLYGQVWDWLCIDTCNRILNESLFICLWFLLPSHLQNMFDINHPYALLNALRDECERVLSVSLFTST